MRTRLVPAGALFALLALAPGRLGAEPTGGLDGTLAEAVRRTAGAARGIVLDDRAVVLADLAGARSLWSEAFDAAFVDPPAPGTRRLLPRMVRFLERILDAEAAAGDPDGNARDAALAIRRAAVAGHRARGAILGESLAGFGLRVSGGGFGRPGRSLLVRLVPGDGAPCSDDPAAAVDEEGPGIAVESIGILGPRRLRVRMGPDAGAATLSVDSCGGTRTLRLFNLGAPGALPGAPTWGDAGAPPASLAYAETEVSWRAGVPSALVPTVTGGIPAEFTFSVAPPLPAGLALDPATGVLGGTPSADAPAADYAIAASNLHGAVEATVRIEVTPALPPEVEFLEDGFVAEPFLPGLSVPVKMAQAPDGRLFFNELATGDVRVVAADGTLRAAPFASVAVQAGGERGLLGLALAPDFAASGHLFVYAVVPAAGPKPVRGQVLRFTAAGDLGGAPTVIVDDLPAGAVQNGVDLQFGPDGKLYLTIGDTGDSSLAQADGSRAGRVLRFEADGTVPADNPVPGDPEWCRGLRNSFDMAFHAATGGLYASENGPTFGDEVNYVLRGRNYGWETLPPGFPLNLVGPRIVQWTPVIVPTGLAFHSGTGFGQEYANDLFVCGYDDADLRRLVLSGPLLTDLDAQVPFARWNDEGGVDQKPLDLLEAPDGSLLVSTFTAIWRIRKYGSP